MKDAQFRIDVPESAAREFAAISGDWNPLHTDAAHAARTPFRRPILHGAYSAGLISRLAGMYLPGTFCLLHSLRLRFVSPIHLPASLDVRGRVVSEHQDGGTVDAAVSDAVSGATYVEASYDFGYHAAAAAAPVVGAAVADSLGGVIVTGVSGGLGSAVVELLGERAFPVSHRTDAGLIGDPDLDLMAQIPEERKIDAIIHCGWPTPDNTRLTQLASAGPAVDHHVARPLRQIINLARLLLARGNPDAVLLLVGSSFADPGRHAYRMPLYTLGKSLLPPLTRSLAIELAGAGKRCITASFDVIDGGMNSRLSAGGRRGHADRVPSGTLPSAADAAAQLLWILENRSTLASGATFTLSGGALP